MSTITADQLRADLAARCRPPRTQKDLARKLGVSLSYLNEVVTGKRMAGPKLLDALGLVREVAYRRGKVRP